MSHPPPSCPHRARRCARRLLALGAGLALAALLAAAEPESPAIPAAGNSAPVGPIRLQDVPVESVLELLERWTGKAVLRPQNLPAVNVSLNLKDEVTRAEALQAVETLLSLNGIAVVPLGERFLKVTPANTAKAEAPELIEGSTLGLPPSGRIVAKLFQLEFLRVSEFTPQLGAMLNPANAAQPVVFEKTNALLVTDSVSNLQRIETLLRQLDRPAGDIAPPRFYTLRHAKAGEVVNKIKGMLAGPLQAQFGGTTTYNADDRTNQIVLFADTRHHALFDDLIARLDTGSGQDTQNEFITLKYAAAKDVAALLTQMVSGQGAATAKLTGPEGVAAPAPKPADPAVTSEPAPVQRFSSLLTILAEERSNAIIASGTADDIRLIREMVAHIDVVLAQVRIEVVIAEVTLSNNSTTGISELGLTVEGDRLTGFRASLPGVSVSDGTVTRAGDGSVVSGTRDLAAEITLAATPRKSTANILSVPNIITSHNREGKIFVGEERPVISSYLNDGGFNTGGQGGGGAGYRSTVNSKDIGIQLTVKPLIGSDGSVQLEITQEVNDVLGEVTIDGNPQPRIGRRSTESFVSARSGEIIVLGGLQRHTDSRSTSRFGPVPILGDLLGSRSRARTRTDLLFFLRPTVLTNTEQDNIPAMQQVETLPKRQREDVLRTLHPSPET